MENHLHHLQSVRTSWYLSGSFAIVLWYDFIQRIVLRNIRYLQNKYGQSYSQIFSKLFCNDHIDVSCLTFANCNTKDDDDVRALFQISRVFWLYQADLSGRKNKRVLSGRIYNSFWKYYGRDDVHFLWQNLHWTQKHWGLFILTTYLFIYFLLYLFFLFWCSIWSKLH